MWKPSFGQTIRNPATTIDDQPNEELAFRRSPRFPKPLPRWEPNGTNKHWIIGWFVVVLPGRRELPTKLI
jgi:hypothetical protein